MSSGFILYSWIQIIIWKHFFQIIKNLEIGKKLRNINKQRKKMILSNHSIFQSNLSTVSVLANTISRRKKIYIISSPDFSSWRLRYASYRWVWINCLNRIVNGTHEVYPIIPVFSLQNWRWINEKESSQQSMLFMRYFPM